MKTSMGVGAVLPFNGVSINSESNWAEIKDASFPSGPFSTDELSNSAIQDITVVLNVSGNLLPFWDQTFAITKLLKGHLLVLQRSIWILGCVSCCCRKPRLSSYLSSFSFCSVCDHARLASLPTAREHCWWCLLPHHRYFALCNGDSGNGRFSELSMQSPLHWILD
ncbi:hypothetical protein Ancab_003705 [Ancistrocladus abbreviatus]